MRKRIGIAIPVVLGVVAAVWFLTRGDGVAEGTLAASGTVEATTAELGFQIAGRIAEVGVDEGDMVSEGQELARLDTSELEAGLGAARARMAAAEARLAEMLAGSRPQEITSAEAALRSAAQRADNARRELERARTLFEGGAISRQALDQAMTAVEVAESTHEQARAVLEIAREGPRLETIQAQRALVEQARADVTRAEATLRNAVVTAPFAGLVTIEHRRVGETVGPGVPVVTLLDRGDRWVRIYVREDAIGRVDIGMAASISSDTYPDRVYDGRVTFIGSEAEFTPRNVQTTEERTRLVYPVKVRITGDAGFELKPGIPADVVLREAGA